MSEENGEQVTPEVTPEVVPTEDWRQSLPENVRGWQEAETSDSADKFWNQIVNMRSHLGQSIRIPSDEASKEDRDAFYQKLTDKVPGLIATPDPENPETYDPVYNALGRPESPEGYQSPEYGDLPIGDEKIGELKAIAHKNGLSDKQFKGFMEEMISSEAQIYNEQLAKTQQSVDELKGEWGQTFDARLGAAIQFAEKSGAPEDLVGLMKKGQVNGSTLRWMHKMADAMGEKSEVVSQGQEGAQVVDPMEATSRASELRGKLLSGKIPPGSKEYNQILNKMVEYQKMAG